MGTNYYWRKQPCSTCAHSTGSWHIGKSSIGWTFSFQALDTDSPTGRPVVSAEDWAEVFRTCDGYIVDEYDEGIHPEAFWEMVEAKAAVEGVKNHSKEYPGWGNDKSYVDAEGHSFSTGNFS